MKRYFSLKRETVSDLTDRQLSAVAGGCIPMLSCQIVKCWVPEVVLTDGCPSNTGC